MYVCLCNGYTEKQIAKTAADTGISCAEKVYESLGGGFCCGTCRDCAQQLVDDVVASEPLTLMAAE